MKLLKTLNIFFVINHFSFNEDDIIIVTSVFDSYSLTIKDDFIVNYAINY